MMLKKAGRMSWRMAGAMLVIVLALAGCGSNGNAPAASEEPNEQGGTADKPLEKVQVVLDWTPNTNHTGLYVARDKGFFKEQGLDVEIIQPGQSGADQMVASGSVQFGVSYQESITMARIAGVPLVSLAAVIQHNTSGFASPLAKGIDSPEKFEGKTYGGWGAPVEEAVIQSLMQEKGADVGKVNMISIGDSDFFTAVKRDIDFAWIYYAWTGVEAELRGEKINMVYLTDYSDKLDYYTPVLSTSEAMIKDKPDIVKAFTAGAAKGYQFAIGNPDEAAEILIKAEPDLNAELVRASQKWLSPKYQDDAPRWGEQKLSVWENYASWMFEHKLLEKELEAEKAFTNEFLPE
ncbi:ABC-type nitrate/sulfonate/bicarbonate transport system substrate-binding protein [Paenibacillus endophyticus]|uniref:ABC-type nitrate/sulfonate/bicarbonate transport system substrate-binding protein n=1 Tax=Paenibacillus endophyticus TaxID=1294268 RepID=A0A7W5C8P5_9BACL|nr:ABC transporter substrate-binding protein [Paenibacillus endophyticus]MBB3152179.1 ABC-type nitrate/sulfonate/bicarbonate transport system substrate-binding protein [Paenibacillus endophyticus]